MAGPGDIWSFAGVPLQADTMRVRAIDGFTAVPPQRGTGFVRSAIPGEMFRGKIHGARVLGLEILLFSRTPDLSGIFNNLDILAKAFNTQYQTEQPLVQNHPTGTIRTALAHCTGWNPKMSDDNTGTLWTGTAEFLMSDPYFYTPQVVSVVPHTGTPPYTVVNHPGTVRTHRIVVSATGISGTNVFIFANYTNGVVFTIVSGLGNFSPSDVLLIDCTAFTYTLNGVNRIGDLTHYGDLPFSVLEPGNNELDVNTGTATVSWYPAYI